MSRVEMTNHILNCKICRCYFEKIMDIVFKHGMEKNELEPNPRTGQPIHLSKCNTCWPLVKRWYYLVKLHLYYIKIKNKIKKFLGC